MSAESRKINEFFQNARKSEVDKLLSDIIFTDRQNRIFDMFYIRKNDVNFIADKLSTSADTINKELRRIRSKLIPVLLIR